MSLRQTIGRTLALKAVVLSIPFEVAVERRRGEVAGHFKAVKHIPPRREGLRRDGVAEHLRPQLRIREVQRVRRGGSSVSHSSCRIQFTSTNVKSSADKTISPLR